MLLSTVEYLDQALEYDRLAREAIKPSDRTKYANRAEYYRWFAGERERYRTQTSSPLRQSRLRARTWFGAMGNRVIVILGIAVPILAVVLLIVS